ncbi:MAG TPA: serine/threonine-protein kinase [Verrucomicrobiae bacterium]|nr:serine/threonine-protein kinase [Verrucomicrobiae bacterium]
MHNPVQWERIQQIFDEASQMPSERREEWLGSACGQDRTLYLQVQSLLLASGEESGLLEREIASYATRVTAAPERIGPYRVVSEIGRGGMGAVYLAERADEQYQRRVAIKVVRGGAASPSELARRFRMERQILAGLQHPNIAQMLDGGVTEDGIPYLVMEFVDGVRIDQYCGLNRVSVRQRIELFRQVCSAVQHAHRNLVVHRDIKPSNILVTAEGVPKLLDFGIAKLLRPADTTGAAPLTAALTTPAERPMTREYASPEQVRGEPVTTATDVYALGIVLYELLAGRHPFADFRTDFLTLERAICERDPLRPSAVAPASAGELKGDLNAIVMKAIRKEQAARYASAEQFSEDLGRYLDGFPVIASQGTRRYRTGKFIRRHRLGVSAAAVFVVLLVGFGTAMSFLAAHLARERTKSQTISRFLSSLFSSSDPYRNRGQVLTAKDLLDRGSARVSKELSGQPEVSEELLQTMAEAYKHLEVMDGAEKVFREEMAAAVRVYGPESQRAADIWRQIGDVQRTRGNLTGAVESLRKSLEIIEKLPKSAEIERAHALNNLALVLQLRGDLSEAETDLRRAVAIASRFPNEADTLTMKFNLATVLLSRGQPEEAARQLREILAERRKILGEKHPQVPHTMSTLSTALAEAGHFSEAEQFQREALERSRILLGDKSSDVKVGMRRLGAILLDEGKLREAEAQYRQGFALGTSSDNAFERALWYAGLGWVLFREGRPDEADPLYQKALETLGSTGRDSLGQARILARYAVLQIAGGKLDAARQDLEKSLRIYGLKAGAGPDEINEARFQMAELDRAQGYRDAAAATYREVVDADRGASPARPLDTAAHLLGYAEFLAAGPGDGPARAEPLAREALDLRQRNLPPDFWSIDVARGVLAGVLARMGRESEARPMAAAACAGLKQKLGAEIPETRQACHSSRGGPPPAE